METSKCRSDAGTSRDGIIRIVKPSRPPTCCSLQTHIYDESSPDETSRLDFLAGLPA